MTLKSHSHKENFDDVSRTKFCYRKNRRVPHHKVHLNSNSGKHIHNVISTKTKTGHVNFDLCNFTKKPWLYINESSKRVMTKLINKQKYCLMGRNLEESNFEDIEFDGFYWMLIIKFYASGKTIVKLFSRDLRLLHVLRGLKLFIYFYYQPY